MNDLDFQYLPLFNDEIEYLEKYRPGGYHPIMIGDTFDEGRYRVVHKLGSGGFSTVWLARDLWAGKDRGKLVALKALCSDVSPSDSLSSFPELAIAKKLQEAFPGTVDLQTVDHHFFVQGPNGTHLILILPLAGPSISSLYNCRAIGSPAQPLPAELAMKIERQVALALQRMHSVGIVHGDLTTANILFHMSPHVIQWSDDEIYSQFKQPLIESVRTVNRQPSPHAPEFVVRPIDYFKLPVKTLLQENIMIVDFGQSYFAASPPPSYVPATLLTYQSPEARFEGRAGFEADIWSLGVSIFEIHTGVALIDGFLQLDTYILRQMVELLGRLPDPWWATFEHRDVWFDEDGQPKSEEEQRQREGNTTIAVPNSIRMSLLSHVKKLPQNNDSMGDQERVAKLKEEEDKLELLADLLTKMIKFSPEERLCIGDVVKHPWFSSYS